MKLKDSITADEKKLLDYVYEKANDIADYCHRNGMIVPVYISVRPDFKSANGKDVFDYRSANFSEDYESGRTKRIVTLSYNFYNDRSEYHESLYEDTDDE